MNAKEALPEPRPAVTATDDTKLVEVKVQVFDSSGNLVEEGAAMRQGGRQ